MHVYARQCKTLQRFALVSSDTNIRIIHRRGAMRIGVPKEIKNHEYRVGLTPASVAELVHAGHELLVATRPGMGIDFGHDAYIAAGAKIAPDAASVFAGS